jgi:RNA polymerase sigma factor (sigma-70 family)
MSPILSLRPLQTQSDARLVALARGGHERAFEVLVRRYRRQLLAYANRLLGAEGRAEDALQHALLQAWIALRDDADVKDVRAWLYRIVHNSAVSTLRRPRHETVELNEALDASASDDGPESRIVVGEVLQGLASLPDLQRKAMVLTAVRGDSHGEAAAALGLSDGAVRGLVYRARATMRDAVAGILPLGLLHWGAGLGSRRTPEVAGATGAAGSAGLAAAVLKGGAVVVTAGALATAGHFAIPKVLGHPHRAVAAAPASAVHKLPHSIGGSTSPAHVALGLSGADVLERHGRRGGLARRDRTGDERRGDSRGSRRGDSPRDEDHSGSGSGRSSSGRQSGATDRGGSGERHGGSAVANGGETSGSGRPSSEGSSERPPGGDGGPDDSSTKVPSGDSSPAGETDAPGLRSGGDRTSGGSQNNDVTTTSPSGAEPPSSTTVEPPSTTESSPGGGQDGGSGR